MPWCSKRRIGRCAGRRFRFPNRAQARYCSRCVPVPCAVPTYTWSTANFRNQSCPSYPATRSSARSSARALAPGVSLLGHALAYPGSAGPAACAPIAATARRTCAQARFTGYTLDGGYAEYLVADERFCFALLEGYSDLEAAPLLCAGLIGYRSLVMADSGRRLGLYGFGAAGHIVIQVARHQGREVYAFTRPGDTIAQEFALGLGATWAGDSTALPPEPLDGAILFAPVGSLVPQALRAVAKGGTVVCGGIHMSDIPSFPYALLWRERAVRSAANPMRRDGLEFLEIAPRVPVRTAVESFPLTEANEALHRLRAANSTVPRCWCRAALGDPCECNNYWGSRTDGGRPDEPKSGCSAATDVGTRGGRPAVPGGRQHGPCGGRARALHRTTNSRGHLPLGRGGRPPRWLSARCWPVPIRYAGAC